MPIEICKISREKRNKMGRESVHHCPDKVYCASQKKYFYGYKLHSVCSTAGVIESLDLTKASVHDIHYLKDVKVIKDILGSKLRRTLFETAGIQLEVAVKKQSKRTKACNQNLKKSEKEN